MGIDAINTGTLAPNTKAQAPDDDGLDRQAFLELLVTQLRYQNPMEPVGNTEFIAQTAQFSSLEQMQDLNKSVQSLIKLQESASKTAVLNLIGKRVIIEDSTISLSGVEPVDLHYSFAEDANVVITVYNANETPVATIEVGEQAAGEHTFVWDGLNSEGIRVSDGEYMYEVSAVNANGREIEVLEAVSGIVDGVIFDDEPYVSIGDLRAPLSAVTEVLLDSTGN